MSEEDYRNLKELRQTLGLSKTSLAESLGVGRDTIRRWENGTYSPQKRFQKKLTDLFGKEYYPAAKIKPRPKEFYDMEELAAKNAAQSQASIARTFMVGHCYNISDTPNPSESSTLQQSTLRYERKEGIHHVFREVRGKWIVTYTDAQLIGKHIKEVQKG